MKIKSISIILSTLLVNQFALASQFCYEMPDSKLSESGHPKLVKKCQDVQSSAEGKKAREHRAEHNHADGHSHLRSLNSGHNAQFIWTNWNRDAASGSNYTVGFVFGSDDDNQFGGSHDKEFQNPVIYSNSYLGNPNFLAFNLRTSGHSNLSKLSLYLGEQLATLYTDVEMTQNLDVLGTIQSHHIKVDGSITARSMTLRADDISKWPDFVFEDDYKLLPLAELESYIRKHKHLPHINSQDEISDKGIDMKHLSAGLTQNVEELTLRLIAQQKQIDTLNKRLTELENNDS